MTCSYYSSPLSVASSMVASRPLPANVLPLSNSGGSCSSSTGAVPTGPNAGVPEGASEHQQLWRPLLQPTFMEGLWLRVQGVWVELGLVSRCPSSGRALPSPLTGSAHSPSAPPPPHATAPTQTSTPCPNAAPSSLQQAAGPPSSQQASGLPSSPSWALAAFVAAAQLPSEEQLLHLRPGELDT